MSNLTVSPQEMRAQAAEFNNLADDIDTLLNDGNSTVEDLQESWKSDASNKFKADWEEQGVTILTSTVEMLNEVAQRLEETAQTYEDTDNELADM
jgi:WXG100 family type VII secretion target